MSFINICRDNTDPFYRYKMPPIQAKVEGRGNGIKTCIVNLSEVSRALGRPPIYLLKYFGNVLGSQTSGGNDDERCLINGVHQASSLQDVLDGFITKFVLCGSCKNPETEIIFAAKQKDILERDCKACGARTKIDPTVKLTSYIIKNKPKKGGKKAATASANIVGGGQTISDIAASQMGTKEVTDEVVIHNEDDDDLTRRIKLEAAALPQAQVADDDWAVDMSEEAIAARARELENVSLEGPQSSFNEFGEWLLSFGPDKENLPTDVDIYKKATELAIVESPETVQVLAQVLFDDDIVSEISQHAGLLTKLATSEEHEKAFLGGLERFLGLEKPELIKGLPKILMTAYNEDIVSEEVVVSWGSKVSKKYVPKEVSKKVRKAAKPFITWLEEAESDDEDE